MIKIEYEPIEAFIERTKQEYYEKYKGKKEYADYLRAYQIGSLKACYSSICQRVDMWHNSELPRMKQGEDAIKLLYEICENTQRTGSGDFIIDKKYIRKIEELLRSE